ncbi:BF3164 family lipoprotein [Balneola vulgaris]|uniref:BF3164 family lipoprotein n=1 Tax=Balneola vulgaris TaxID=287535 RepID=UPI00037AB58D|nr:BF3164 family lipoprotein [Balneola vulgaris]
MNKGFLSIIYVFVIFSRSWYPLGEASESLFNPNHIVVLEEDRILVNDPVDNVYPIRSINFTLDEEVAHLREGRGPGEVSPMFYKRFTKFSNGDLLIWDAGLSRIGVFTANLTHKRDLTWNTFEAKIYQAALINDSTLVTIDYSENFLKAWRINKTGFSESDLLWQHSLSKSPELKALSNPLMLQTLLFANDGERLLIAFKYSSLIINVTEAGVHYLTDGPEGIPIPNPQIKGGFSLPDINIHPVGAIDISVGEDYIYVVFSGRIVSKSELQEYASDIDLLLEQVEHANRLWVFDKSNGDFVKEVNLPKSAKSFQIIGRKAYLLNTLEDYPKITKYQLPDDL